MEEDMKTIQLEIDGIEVRANEGTTILDAAAQNGINIPNFCHHEKLHPYGACRLCMVEISKNGRSKLVASCVYEVEPDLVVKTNTKRIRKIRRMIIELAGPALQCLAEEYGVTESRFPPDQTECSLCGLCVRYCAEVKKLNAVYFKNRGIDREVAIVPGFERECTYCRECFDLCSGGLIVALCDRAFA